jgi:DNA polymerase-3 subunit epsilon
VNGKIAPLVFIDVETTGLDLIQSRIWEVGLIRRTSFGDVEHHAMIKLSETDLSVASPKALEVGRFRERYSDPDAISEARLVRETHLSDFLSGAILVGANVQFDERFLSAMFARHGVRTPWSYRLLEVESYAAGAFGAEPPWSLDDLLTAYAVHVPEGARHTALGDARAERDLYDAARKLRRER